MASDGDGKGRVATAPGGGYGYGYGGYEGPEDAVTIPADAIALREALSNLIHNALKHGARSRLTVRVGRERGRVLELPGGGAAWITVHPSYLLRLPDEAQKAEEYARFVEDLRVAHASLG